METKHSRTLYFAYGSNMCPEQMKRRQPQARMMYTATLHGYRLTFAGFSHNWNGGVATIVPDLASTVSGVVWANVDLERMDRYEGAPHSYQRAVVQPRRESPNGERDGTVMRCVTYVKRDDDTSEPSVEYAQRIAAGYEAAGLDIAPLIEAIKSAKGKTPGELVFVYGSLMHGLGNHRLLGGSEFVNCAVVNGYDMLDLGSYPGIVPNRESETEIFGEVYRVTPNVLRRLDKLEGHPHFYRRTELSVEIQGEQRKVWLYVLNSSHARSKRLVTAEGAVDWYAYYQNKQS